ncbi:hypothetical protein [Pedobacter sp. NJ-S-72]
MTVSGGTNKRYGLNVNDYIWRDVKQIGVNGNAGNTNTGAGISTNANAGTSYRDKIGEKLIINGNYNYSYNKKNESVYKRALLQQQARRVLFIINQ